MVIGAVVVGTTVVVVIATTCRVVAVSGGDIFVVVGWARVDGDDVIVVGASVVLVSVVGWGVVVEVEVEVVVVTTTTGRDSAKGASDEGSSVLGVVDSSFVVGISVAMDAD